jgi:hypothetical protein
MSLCIYCQKQKGKRSCPALNGLICPSCCGQHRGVRINCPISCKYFKAHESYQKDRQSDEFHANWIAATQPLYHQKKYKAIDLIAQLEIAIFQHFRDKAAGNDREVFEALEFLKRRLSPVLIVETTATTLGNTLSQTLEEFLKKESFSPEHAHETLDILLQFVQKQIDAENPRQYLHGLLGHVEKYFELPEKVREAQSPIAKPSIVTPDQI